MAEIDAGSVLFAGASISSNKKGKLRYAIEDINDDGFRDFVGHFNTQDTLIQCGDIIASITGQTYGGLAFEGSDSIVTVGCK